MDYEKLSKLYELAVSASRALAHGDPTPEKEAQLKSERAGYLFRFNELLGYKAEV
jgi:hypothetical protein